ncbi:hypothetical protein NQ314_015600 [Rhamnusium bicolor]|uniref:DDE Tnp4 domain-containing protein n=1 Tax=Rhamnusium bicolor TaxID=1586634 RepID=A0AAV8WXQ6_9CUCU|nr:hypothetical protein NQ314_015600 [Rhamnusium bicolor]
MAWQELFADLLLTNKNIIRDIKRFHCVKYQSVICPDGIVISLKGAYPGRRHDSGIFRESGLYEELEQCAVFENGENYVLYEDQAYGIKRVMSLSKQGNNSRIQTFNTDMSACRQAVEWGFQKIITEFAFVDFKKNQKLFVQEIEKIYLTAMILTNCHTCLYGSQTTEYFHCIPPNLEEYILLQQKSDINKIFVFFYLQKTLAFDCAFDVGVACIVTGVVAMSAVFGVDTADVDGIWLGTLSEILFRKSVLGESDKLEVDVCVGVACIVTGVVAMSAVFGVDTADVDGIWLGTLSEILFRKSVLGESDKLEVDVCVGIISN